MKSRKKGILMRFFIFVFLVVGCGGSICIDSDFELESGVCVFSNNFDVKEKEIELIVETTKKHLIERGYTSGDVDSVFYGNQISISFRKEVVDNGDVVGGLCRYDGFNKTFEIEVSYHGGKRFNTSINIVIHELLHVFLISNEGDFSHKVGWFVFADGLSFPDDRSLQSLVFDGIRP